MKFEDFKDGVYRNQAHAGGLFGLYELLDAEEPINGKPQIAEKSKRKS